MEVSTLTTGSIRRKNLPDGALNSIPIHLFTVAILDSYHYHWGMISRRKKDQDDILSLHTLHYVIKRIPSLSGNYLIWFKIKLLNRKLYSTCKQLCPHRSHR